MRGISSQTAVLPVLPYSEIYRQLCCESELALRTARMDGVVGTRSRLRSSRGVRGSTRVGAGNSAGRRHSSQRRACGGRKFTRVGLLSPPGMLGSRLENSGSQHEIPTTVARCGSHSPYCYSRSSRYTRSPALTLAVVQLWSYTWLDLIEGQLHWVFDGRHCDLLRDLLAFAGTRHGATADAIYFRCQILNTLA